MIYSNLLLPLICISLFSCSSDNSFIHEKPVAKKVESKTILQQVDELDGRVKESISDYALVASLDHHRMAKESGVYTPPAIASIFSNAELNSELLVNGQQLLALDLPFKVLAFAESDTTKSQLAYTSSDFITKRHGLDPQFLKSYETKMVAVLENIGSPNLSKTNLESVGIDFGIVKIQSDFDFDSTVQKLKAIVNAQSDTKWFGEIDYKNEAKPFEKELRPTTLLLFGGPAPGGKAMMTTPKIGLDAFCQKLLVYQNEKDEVWVAYNDIIAFAELYYQSYTKPQQMINQRLMKTFSSAISKETKD